MSDGRVSNKIFGTTIVIKENCKKLLRINDNVCVGFTGGVDACLCTLKALEPYNMASLGLHKTVSILYEKAKTVHDENHFLNNAISMVVGGKTNKSMEFHVFGSKYGFKKTIHQPKGDNLEYLMLYSDRVESDTFLKHLQANIPLNSIEKHEKAMKDCIDEVAKSDDTVNAVKFKEVIVLA